jgi:hypothetical protein
MSFTVIDKRGLGVFKPKEVCRVCGSTDVHSTQYNKPTMDCIHYLKKPLKPKDEFTFFYGGEFSQWYPAIFVIDNTIYDCAEQFMMAMKAVHFKDKETLKLIMATTDPKEQKALGRKVKNFDAKEWNKVAIGYVYIGNFAKFTQNYTIKQVLIHAKGTLVEASPYDRIWGIGLGMDNPLKEDRKNWRGQNLLGIALTQVRDAIIAKGD